MNLYHKKQRWKISLAILAIVLVLASLWFSNSIVKKVASKEKERVTQWADAIKRKAELVNLTNSAFDKLRENERKKVELWTLSMQEVNKDLDDYSFVVSILQNTGTLPMIIVNNNNQIETTHNLAYLDDLSKTEREDSLRKLIDFWKVTHSPLTLNLFDNDIQTVYYYDSKKLEDLSNSKDSLFNAFSEELIHNKALVPVVFIDKNSREIIGTNIKNIDSTSVNQKISKLKKQNDSIVVDLGTERKGVIYYEHSPELTQLKYFPIVQFVMIGLFILIGYLVFSTFRKAEQDQVWVGMAKETAHQLGTPISSLMAWVQLLETQGIDASTITEMNKDIDRLNIVTNRFSKIGSKAILKPENIVPVLKRSTEYLRKRISNKVELSFYAEQEEIIIPINAPLLEWVVENICKNAVDAMEGKGFINIKVKQLENDVIIDIEDNGKGIPANKLKTVFQPGYTTKSRGWGLGLSLVKRIIEDFHKGKIFVLSSEINKGTTFRIILKP
ncbi:MAG TPA: HAMP domain-containing histidine kinase [Crocinitomix sp.]|nr:HAMP domain-containing histidine kinase [Crocinitomix sp.]